VCVLVCVCVCVFARNLVGGCDPCKGADWVRLELKMSFLSRSEGSIFKP